MLFWNAFFNENVWISLNNSLTFVTKFKLTIFKHCFWYWLGTDQMTSHDLKQWWLVERRIYEQTLQRVLFDASGYSFTHPSVRGNHYNFRAKTPCSHVIRVVGLWPMKNMGQLVKISRQLAFSPLWHATVWRWHCSLTHPALRGNHYSCRAKTPCSDVLSCLPVTNENMGQPVKLLNATV